MIIEILIGVFFGLLVFLSGWFRVLFLTITGGLFGNFIPWLYLTFGITIGSGYYSKIFTFNYWTLFITTMLCTALIQGISSKYELKTIGVYGTISTSGSMMLFGGLLGMIYYLIFQ